MWSPIKLIISSWWSVAAIVVVIGAIFGYFFFGHSSNLGATLTIAPGDFKEQVTVSGAVTAAQNVALGFAASGRISGVYASVGQHVAQGAVIAEIENGDLAAALSQKQSALDGARANFAALKAGTRPEELAVAATTVLNAQSALVNAIQSAYSASDDAVHNKIDSFFTNPRTNPKLTFIVSSANLKTVVEDDRITVEPVLSNFALLASGLSNSNADVSAKQSQVYIAQVTTLLADVGLALSQGVPDQTTSSAALSAYSTTLSTARSNVNSSATTLSADISALSAAQSALTLKQAGATTDALTAQQAMVASAEADVRSAVAMFAKTRIAAPFAGTVTRMDAKVGEIVSPTTSEITMQGDGVFQIETYVPETVIARVAVGNSAVTTLDAYGSAAPFPSTVVSVDPAETVKDGVPAYKTTLAFLANDPRIRSGMTADTTINTGILHDAIVIPTGAIGIKDSAHYVSVVEQDKAVVRIITTGISPMLGQTEILSGLSAGDVILLTPAP